MKFFLYSILFPPFSKFFSATYQKKGIGGIRTLNSYFRSDDNNYIFFEKFEIVLFLNRGSF